MLYDIAVADLHRHAPTTVDLNNADRAPPLLVAFEEDRIVPAKASRHNAERYKTGTVEFKSFAGRPHFPGAPGRQEIADYALSWAVEHAAGGKLVAGRG